MFLIVTPHPYLFHSNGTARLTGIEDVGAGSPPTGLTVPLPPGRWTVVVHLLASDEEPGAKDVTGAPGPNALPDFLLLVAPEAESGRTYRHDSQTFPPPG